MMCSNRCAKPVRPRCSISRPDVVVRADRHDRDRVVLVQHDLEPVRQYVPFDPQPRDVAGLCPHLGGAAEECTSRERRNQYPVRPHDVGGLNCACWASTHDLWYNGSSIASAAFAIFSGRKESIMTANSLVNLAPMLASARPGCGP